MSVSRQAYWLCLGSRICQGSRIIVDNSEFPHRCFRVVMKLSGLPKAINHTIRVRCRNKFIFVQSEICPGEGCQVVQIVSLKNLYRWAEVYRSRENTINAVRWRNATKVQVNGREQGLIGKEDLQMMLIDRFCKFQKQNRALSYASVRWTSRSSRVKTRKVTKSW